MKEKYPKAAFNFCKLLIYRDVHAYIFRIYIPYFIYVSLTLRNIINICIINYISCLLYKLHMISLCTIIFQYKQTWYDKHDKSMLEQDSPLIQPIVPIFMNNFFLFTWRLFQIHVVIKISFRFHHFIIHLLFITDYVMLYSLYLSYRHIRIYPTFRSNLYRTESWMRKRSYEAKLNFQTCLLIRSRLHWWFRKTSETSVV